MDTLLAIGDTERALLATKAERVVLGDVCVGCPMCSVVRSNTIGSLSTSCSCMSFLSCRELTTRPLVGSTPLALPLHFPRVALGRPRERGVGSTEKASALSMRLPLLAFGPLAFFRSWRRARSSASVRIAMASASASSLNCSVSYRSSSAGETNCSMRCRSTSSSCVRAIPSRALPGPPVYVTSTVYSSRLKRSSVCRRWSIRVRAFDIGQTLGSRAVTVAGSLRMRHNWSYTSAPGVYASHSHCAYFSSVWLWRLSHDCLAIWR